MFTAYTGNGHYCYSNSLHMCLRHAGMEIIPTVGQLECMTGMPFGALFLRFEKKPYFFPSHAAVDPHNGLTRALNTVGWTCNLWQGDDREAALDTLRESLETGPVLLGPLDLGFLPYDPNHRLKRGGDHFIVALKLEGDCVQVHDPQLYPFAVLTVDDLMRAWQFTVKSYVNRAYTLRGCFREERHVSHDDMLRETFQSARELIQLKPDGPVFFGGSEAYLLAAEEIGTRPSKFYRFLLTQFSLPLGGSRCLDAAEFMKSVGQAEAAEWMVKKAETYGLAQYHATRKDWKCTKGLFKQLAEMEDRIAECV